MGRSPRRGAAKPIATVRMYKGLLGDCFLLRVKQGDSVSHILVDCGILQNVPGDAARMKAVAEDIVAATGGRLDLLVVTHEHHDHISGFAHASEVFFSDRLKIDNLWMGWTENDDDPQAKALNARFNKVKHALAVAGGRAVALEEAGVPGAAAALAGLENFIGPFEAVGGALGATERLTGRVIMRKLKEKVRADGGRPLFLEPGSVLDTPGEARLRAHVLGPPRTEARLFQDLPTRRAGESHETYLDQRFAAADQLLGLETDRPGGDRPFPPRYALTETEVQAGGNEAADWLRDRYYGDTSWQRVDTEWLGSASMLALKLDSDTNNTSLALAFETTPGGKVLLFAADAQVGNWLSWHDQTYGDPPVAAADLLERTVLYKVGHHASHNATLRDQGLELMRQGELTAMIPVVEEVARAQGRKDKDGKPTGWNMPYPPLLARLEHLTAGRVIRGDRPLDLSLFPPGQAREQDLWVEVDIVG